MVVRDSFLVHIGSGGVTLENAFVALKNMNIEFNKLISKSFKLEFETHNSNLNFCTGCGINQHLTECAVLDELLTG